MVADRANDGLKARRQKAHIVQLQLFRTDGADEQIRENPGQTQHPNLEVTHGEVDGASLFQRAHGHSNQPEHRVLRFVLRQKTIDKLDEAAGANGTLVILKQLHRRIQKIGGLDPHQIPVFLLEKLDSGMRQRLERSTEPVFHFSRPVRHTAQLAVIAAEKRHDPIGLSERVCLQYNRVALMEGHTVPSEKRNIGK